MASLLIIDDEEGIRSIVSAMLREEGYTVHEAQNAEEGLSLIRTEGPDLVICDIFMEGMSGFDVLKRIRADEKISTIPFIFITGVGGKKNYRDGMDLGADDFLEKPFTKAELLASVRTRFRIRQALRYQGEKKLRELQSSISQALPHEFRTPLNAILAFSQIIRDDDELLPEERRKFGNLIHLAGERLHRLAENYLLFADIEVASSDQDRLLEMQQSVAEHAEKTIAASVHDVVDEAGRSRDLILHVEPVSLMFSASHLAKMIREVVGNAAKFSDPGTALRVQGRRIEGLYTIDISDAGIGMSAEQIRDVGVFRQFDRKKREQQGTGFGLELAIRLSELHGGSLNIRSSQGVGTSIHITCNIAEIPVEEDTAVPLMMRH